jgi:hypothetical protein
MMDMLCEAAEQVKNDRMNILCDAVTQSELATMLLDIAIAR